MKIISLALVFLTIVPKTLLATHLNGTDLIHSIETGLGMVKTEIDENSIIAWESKLDESGMRVKLLNEDNILFEYSCQKEQQLTCHKLASTKKNSADHQHAIAFSSLKSGSQAALAKFEKTLKRRGSGLQALSLIKVWTHKGDHHSDHDHGPNVWSQFNYQLNGQQRTIFVLCHQHDQDSDFACHFRKDGEHIPTF